MIKVGIVGYGNLGRGVELALRQNQDMELVAIFTRRDPKTLQTVFKTPVVAIEQIETYKNKIDVMILCGGSATDLPKQTPMIAKHFNVVDSFDTHATINKHFQNVDQVAKASKTVAIISIGWDPGLFSVNRLYAKAILPDSHTYTFWGDGVSQGHSDAIRRVAGVKYAVQYTRPIKEAVDLVRSGTNPTLTARESHWRECFVVADELASKQQIEETITTMPNYFSDYLTVVHFISEEEYFTNHQQMPHGGHVISSSNQQIIEYKLKLNSNPEFTAATLVAYARASVRLSKEGVSGAKTIFDIAPSYLVNIDDETLRSDLL